MYRTKKKTVFTDPRVRERTFLVAQKGSKTEGLCCGAVRVRWEPCNHLINTTVHPCRTVASAVNP